MVEKISAFIMTVVMLLIITVMGFFGVIIWNEIRMERASIEVKEFESEVVDTEEEFDKKITIAQILENPFNAIKDNKNNKNEIDYSNISVDKFFYNQLDEEAQIIYKAFEKNKEKMKTGRDRIELGSNFTTILNRENGQEELGKIYQSAIEAYTYDNPDVFYLSPNKMYLNIETTTTARGKKYDVYIDSGKEANYLANEYYTKEQIDQAVIEIESIRDEILQNRTGNIYKDIKMVHDYLVNNVKYDTSLMKDNIYNIYGALVNGEAVCEGYARAFKYIMDSMGIECTMVIGKGTNSEGKTENHAWNYVLIDDRWYAVDCTWDDPVITGSGWLSDSAKYKYFLKGRGDISKDHVPSGQFTDGGKIFTYPDLSIYNYY